MLDFMFIFFASLALLGGLLMAFHPNIVHSAFALVAALFGVAGLYWTLGADFLGATQVLLYVGGITVLLLFAVMLSTRDAARISIARYALMAPIVGLLGAFLVTTGKALVPIVRAAGGALGPTEPTTEKIGNLFMDPTAFMLPFEILAVLLLVVLVGAITLARRGEEDAA